METTKRTKKTGKITEAILLDRYKTHLLSAGTRPVSVFQFCAGLGIPESEFYAHFASFEALEKSVWKGYATQVITLLNNDKNYAGFAAREKVLSFYYTLAEVLKKDRSFVLQQLAGWKIQAIPPQRLKAFKSVFDLWIEGVITTGKQSEEIATRPFLDKQYDQLFWLHLLFVLHFWIHDESANFEKTDMAIEKSVNLAFDLIGKGVLDNALDFGKFLYQTAKN